MNIFMQLIHLVLLDVMVTIFHMHSQYMILSPLQEEYISLHQFIKLLRPVDLSYVLFAPDSMTIIPRQYAPYNHSNIDSDEVLYYVDGDFMSRNHVNEGYISLHPAGIPHGPHPGAMERSIGKEKQMSLL